MERELKYSLVSFDPKTWKFTRTDKIYKYQILTVKKWKKKYNYDI